MREIDTSFLKIKDKNKRRHGGGQTGSEQKRGAAKIRTRLPYIRGGNQTQPTLGGGEA